MKIFQRDEHSAWENRSPLLIFGKDLKTPIVWGFGILYIYGGGWVANQLGIEIVEDLGEAVSTGRYTETTSAMTSAGIHFLFVGFMIIWKLNMIFDGKQNPLYRVWLLGGLSFILVSELVHYFLGSGWIFFGFQIVLIRTLWSLFGKWHEKRKAKAEE
jgi:hypothetical protein